MAIASLAAEDSRAFKALDSVPQIDLSSNLRAAVAARPQQVAIFREVMALRWGPGKLTHNEYFYYRLWEPRLTAADRRAFVGKLAQALMHSACNDRHWYMTGADKLLFHLLMRGAGLPAPELLAITAPDRRLPGVPMLAGAAEIAAFLGDRDNYPLFAKPIDGKFSLAVISADDYDPAADRVLLQGNEPVAPADLATALAGRAAGYVIQRRMAPDAGLAALFGPRLWSVRVLILLQPDGPLIHRAVAKIATGQNPADNFWRPGNMVGAIELSTGRIVRVVRGTGAAMAVDEVHPDTGHALVGTPIPHWDALTTLVRDAARLLPGIRTQSWDMALTAAGPIPLEVNYGGDLNLSQLASGIGVLDDTYRAHLRRCGYKI